MIKMPLGQRIFVIQGDDISRTTSTSSDPLYQIQPDVEEPYLTGFHFEDACLLEIDLVAKAPPRLPWYGFG